MFRKPARASARAVATPLIPLDSIQYPHIQSGAGVGTSANDAYLEVKFIAHGWYV